ncbi:MAG: hypothetical protein KJ621_03750 [Proteobacteria bacterium]|nr:hypothetical protein [Pseudomonadota bacterium]
MADKPKKKKRPRDPNQLAHSIVKDATDPEPDAPPEDDGKNPHAVALGRLGGQKGGRARAAKLSAKRRKEIAKKAAQARWSKKK